MIGGWTNFDKAWFAPALAKWLQVGLVEFVEHTFNFDIPVNIEGYILVGLTSVIVYFVKNKDKEAQAAAPAA
jgi:hypothetical protein